jgi:DNA mismatch repair protein MutL
LLSLYLLCEKDEELVIIDQHAAHERILYEQLRQGYLERTVPSQSLVFPITVELSPQQSEQLAQQQEMLGSLGFDVDHFGEESWIIKAVPAMLDGLAPMDILMDSLQSLDGVTVRETDSVLPAAVDDLLASLACKAAVKSGHRLQPLEMLELLQQMEQSDVFSHCPHGRPVIKHFSRREIEKWFKRIV